MQQLQRNCSRLTVQRSRTQISIARRISVVVQAKQGKRRTGPAGFVEEDNSGRANIFAVEPKTLYTSSPTADRAAQQGLGGLQGLAVLAAALALVALTTLGVAKSPDNSASLQAAAGVGSQESLTALAARIAASL